MLPLRPESRHTIATRDIIGKKVMNIEGETLGRIEELVIDAKSGHIAYAALSVGGLWGVGAKLLAVPWSSLRPSTLDDVVYLDVEKQRLREAPGFDRDHWPDVDLQYLEDVHAHYRAEPHWLPHQ
jgi:sporulation protein YlmC with PRC-barrel domain